MADETCLFPTQRLPRNPVAHSADDSVVEHADVLDSLDDLAGRVDVLLGGSIPYLE